MITANQPQVINRPLQVRCCSQPMGFRSSLARIQRGKNESQRKGVQKVFSHQSCRAEGGSSRQRRCTLQAAHLTSKKAPNSEHSITMTSATSQPLWALGGRLPNPCDQKSCERKTSMNAVCMNWSRVGHPIPPRPPSPKATIMITKEKQWKMTNTDPTTKQSITANVIARVQVLERDEASRPAPNARKIELKFTHTDAAASFQLTPPKSIGMAATGSTASHNVRARKPWTSPLAATMSLACSRVRKSSPRVPSRRSRLRQSTVSSGTKIQIAQKSVKWRLPKSRPPRVGPKLCWRPKRPLATSKAPAPRPRK